MPNNRDGIGTIFINNKNYKGIKVGTSSVKRKYNIPDENGYTILKIKCSTGSNILNIFNQLTLNVESIEIFNESNININTNTDLPNLNVDNGSTNQYTTWTLPNGNYKVFIKGEFSIKDSKCEILKVKLQNNLTTGYKMFYNCNIVKANLDYGIKIPDSMTNTESMFENSNIDHTAEINLLTTTRCSAMYKNCTNLKKIHINYIEAFNNESTLCPNLSESDYDECFTGCSNIRCGNLNSNTNNKPAIFLWDNIPYYWGGLEYSDYIDSSYNYFIVNANNANGMSLTLYENPDHSGDLTLYITNWGDGTIDNNSSHTYSNEGTYTVKTKLQSGSNALENNNIIECKNIRNDITNMEGFFCNFKVLSKVSSIPNGVTNMVRCFKDCTTFNQVITLPNTIKEIIYIFEGCSSFNKPLIIPEGPISLEGILKNCTSFNQSIELPSSTTNLNFAFYNCSSFNKPITIPGSVTSLKFSLQGCSSFNHPITIPNRATNIGAMFRGCTSFNQPVIIPDSVENIEQTFYDCNSLNSPITIGSGVTNMIAAFHQCGVFNQDIEIPNSVTNLTYMLQNCNSYNSLVTFNLTSDSNQTLDNIFAGASVSNIKIKGEITNNYMNRILGILVNPTTIDILELSNPNILSIIEDETIMNTINTGKQGTPHTLLWAEPTYNYFIVEPNDTNGLLMNLYENEPIAETVSTLSLSGNQTDWGDGNIDENSTHTYTSGKYLIKTKLQIMNITEYNNYWNNYNGNNGDYMEPAIPITKCMSIRKDIDNMDYFFAGPSIHLVHVCEIPDNITSMNGTFANCIEFNQTFNIPNNVTDISFILMQCNAFNKPLTIPDSVENMMYSFAICHSFNRPVTIPNNVIDCMGLFYMCTSFNQEVILPNKVINIGEMLAGCTKFNQPLVIPSSVIQAFGLFAGCNVFNQSITIPRSVVNCNSMFMDCVAFNKPITFESGSKIESLRLFLSGCSLFNQPLVIPDGVTDIAYLLRGFRDGNRVNMVFNSAITIPDSVTDMSYTFYNCTSFNQPVHISNNCTTMEVCFNYCHQFNQPLEIPSSVTNISHGIYNCAKMESKVTFNFNAESTINFDVTSFFSSPIKEVKIKGYCSNNRLINLSDNLSASPAIIDIRELSITNIISISEDSNVQTSIDSKGHTLLWKDETFNYFVVYANSTNGMSLTLYENPDKTREATIYTTDWCDGTVDNNTSHTYSADGIYIIKTKLQSSSSSSENYNITNCLNIRNDITDMHGFFYNLASLIEIPELPSGITSLRDTFFGCTSFNQQVNIPSTVTLMNGTFFGCKSFNQPVVIPDGVETLNGTLYGCTNFNSSINFGSGVKILDRTLQGCTSFNQSVTIPNSVIDIVNLFDGCKSYSSTITFNVLSDSDLTLSNIFTNSTVNNIKFTGELSNGLMTDILSELVNPTTIDIRELSETNTNSIINDSRIMNTINTGIGGTSHTLLKERLVEVEYPSFNNWSYGGTEITASEKNFHVTGISNSHDAPYCFFESTPLIVGQKYRFTVDLIEGDFYLLVGMENLNNPLNLTFTNNSVDFVADQAYNAFGMDSKSGNYPFNVNIQNLTLYKVIENW